MPKKSLLLPKNILIVIIAANIALIIYGALCKLYGWSFSDFVLGFSIALFTAAWIVCFIDMIRHKIYNKVFWIISLFILPQLSTLFYVIQREKLIRLGEKF